MKIRWKNVGAAAVALLLFGLICGLGQPEENRKELLISWIDMGRLTVILLALIGLISLVKSLHNDLS